MTTVFVTKEADKCKLLEVLRATKVPYRAEIKQGGTRSIQQNRYLWGCVYEIILKESGLGDDGWTNKDLHNYFLGEHFGWIKIEGFGMTKVKPVHTSSTLTKMEFVDYVSFVQQRVAERYGIVIPDPEET